MRKLATNHFLNYTIRSVNTAHISLSFLKIVFTHIRSTFAVASSITRILFLLNNALAKHINCRWPTLKLEPPSDTSASNPSSKPKITCSSCTCGRYSYLMYKVVKSFQLYCTSFKAFHSLSLSCSLNGSKLYLTVPLNNTGSCVIHT